VAGIPSIPSATREKKSLHSVCVFVRPLSIAVATNAVNAVVLENARQSNVKLPSESSDPSVLMAGFLTRILKPSMSAPGHVSDGLNAETTMILSCVTKVHAGVAKRLYLKTSHVAVVGLSSKLLFHAALSHRRATFHALDPKLAVIPKLLITAMGGRRSVLNALS
jgi:hypothetical protein